MTEETPLFPDAAEKVEAVIDAVEKVEAEISERAKDGLQLKDVEDTIKSPETLKAVKAVEAVALSCCVPKKKIVTSS